jgi:hypothetical protein
VDSVVDASPKGKVGSKCNRNMGASQLLRTPPQAVRIPLTLTLSRREREQLTSTVDKAKHSGFAYRL